MNSLWRSKRLANELQRENRARQWVFVNGKGFREGVEWLD